MTLLNTPFVATSVTANISFHYSFWIVKISPLYRQKSSKINIHSSSLQDNAIVFLICASFVQSTTNPPGFSSLSHSFNFHRKQVESKTQLPSMPSGGAVWTFPSLYIFFLIHIEKAWDNSMGILQVSWPSCFSEEGVLKSFNNWGEVWTVQKRQKKVTCFLRAYSIWRRNKYMFFFLHTENKKTPSHAFLNANIFNQSGQRAWVIHTLVLSTCILLLSHAKPPNLFLCWNYSITPWWMWIQSLS